MGLVDCVARVVVMIGKVYITSTEVTVVSANQGQFSHFHHTASLLPWCSCHGSCIVIFTAVRAQLDGSWYNYLMHLLWSLEGSDTILITSIICRHRYSLLLAVSTKSKTNTNSLVSTKSTVNTNFVAKQKANKKGLAAKTATHNSSSKPLARQTATQRVSHIK